PNAENNAATEDTIVVSQADLSITKTDEPDPVIAGESLTYTLTITNAGPSDAAGVVVTDTLPTGGIFDSATPSQGTCSEVEGVVVCDLGTIVHGDNATIAIVMTVDPASSGLIINTAQVTGDGTDPRLEDNGVEEGTVVTRRANLSVTKVDDPDPVVAGGALTYTLTIANAGPSDASGVIVTDTLPAEVATSSIIPSQGSCGEAESMIACELGDVPSGDIATVIIVTVVDPSASGVITDTAQVVGNETDPDTQDNQIIEETTLVRRADLSITKADEPDPVVISGTLTYILTVVNLGPSDATGVIVTDTLPAEVTFNSVTPSQGSCGGVAGVVTCELGTVVSGGTATVTLAMTPTVTGLITNTAQTSGREPDPDTENNMAQQETTVAVYGQVAGWVFVDLDGDGHRNPYAGETVGVPGVYVTLRDEGRVLITVRSTNPTGWYQFDEIPPGRYWVEEEQPDGYASTSPDVVEVEVVAGRQHIVDFGEQLFTPTPTPTEVPPTPTDTPTPTPTPTEAPPTPTPTFTPTPTPTQVPAIESYLPLILTEQS
ncbi:MAG: DUF11 domain-containing protein, partial [Chloroflexi bacterium]|nr:DUF11 domain-containing protein [Chloroflexota bacterium]